MPGRLTRAASLQERLLCLTLRRNCSVTIDAAASMVQSFARCVYWQLHCEGIPYELGTLRLCAVCTGRAKAWQGRETCRPGGEEAEARTRPRQAAGANDRQNILGQGVV